MQLPLIEPGPHVMAVRALPIKATVIGPTDLDAPGIGVSALWTLRKAILFHQLILPTMVVG